jgi:hypothetical protein
MLSYDLHVHPGPSAAPRWGDGRRVWEAAAAAGVKGFVWKAHERHTIELCRQLPQDPVRAIGSASLNPWATVGDVMEAVDTGARWIWGPTLGRNGDIGWELPLPEWWESVATGLATAERRLVLATGHLGAEGRASFAELADAHEHLICSVTHSLYVPPDELGQLAKHGCVFEIDAYTLTTEIEGRKRFTLRPIVEALMAAGALVYFTSDGGQEATGDPFVFGARTLERVALRIGARAAAGLGVGNPEELVGRLDEARA